MDEKVDFKPGEGLIIHCVFGWGIARSNHSHIHNMSSKRGQNSPFLGNYFKGIVNHIYYRTRTYMMTMNTTVGIVTPLSS